MISTGTLKQYLNIDGTSKDTFLSVCIASATGEVESYCNRKFKAGNYTDYLDGNCNSRFFIKNYPIHSITDISYYDGNAWQVLSDSTSNFILPEINAVQLEKNVLPKGKNNIKVNYNAGWNEDECNGDIKGIIIENATINYFNSPFSGKARIGLKSESFDIEASASSSYKNVGWRHKVAKYRVRLNK